jgi:hypothetical protein
MKKSLTAIAATALIIVMSSSTSYAQDRSDSTSGNKADVNFSTGKDNMDKSIRATNPAIAAKFSALFPAATNMRWTNSDKNFWVSFLNDGRKATASFTLKGKLNYVITDCVLEQLPESFLKLINKDYASHSLFNAIEIRAYDEVTYQAILENESGYITLKYTGEGVEELQRINKVVN